MLQILGTILLVWLLIHLGINPILKAVERIRTDRPIQESGANEFRYLAHAYNSMTVQLSEENELLKDISETDALTGLRNRLALRNDYDTHNGHEVTVMLLDLDSFKMINDTYGHDEGDRVLSETGRLLADAFGKQHSYRYGGDEFLVIDTGRSEAEFVKRLDLVTGNRPVLEKDGVFYTVGFSTGYVHAVLNGSCDLRDLFSEADQRMYKIKREIESKRQSRIVLESVINLAGALGMDVVTEGVETAAQLSSLKAMGCRHFQGYYCSRPVTAAEFEKKYSGISEGGAQQ